jgi:CRP-like cAMP-binding protein
MTTVAELLEFSIFAGLSEDELSLLADVARERHYRAGAKIIEKDDTGASLFLIREGAVKVTLPRRDGEDVQLNEMGAGEFFGEMSLFDGKPRSAIVYADIDTTVIEIERDRFLEQIREKPGMALRILAVMAERVRSSDQRISEIADRVYREAYPRIDSAVATQLEAAKVIYEKTEDRASRVLSDVERSWTTLTRFITIILGVVSVVGGIIAYLGYSELKNVQDDVAEDVAQIDLARDEAASRLKEITAIADASREANIAKEIVLEIGRIRHEFMLDQDQGSDSHELTRRKAIQFNEAESQLYDNYLKDFENWEPQIVLEAAIVYVQFIRQAGFYPDAEKVETVVDALISVLDNIRKKDWRARTEVGETLEALGRLYDGAWVQLVTAKLEQRLEKKLDNQSAEREFAQVLFALDDYSGRQRQVLLDAMYNGRSEWTRLAAAVNLIKADEKPAWDVLLTHLNSMGHDGFISAYYLGNVGPEKLRQLGICRYRNQVHGDDPLQLIARRLQWEIDNVFKRTSTNPYQKRYTGILLERFRKTPACAG